MTQLQAGPATSQPGPPKGHIPPLRVIEVTNFWLKNFGLIIRVHKGIQGLIFAFGALWPTISGVGGWVRLSWRHLSDDMEPKGFWVSHLANLLDQPEAIHGGYV